MTRNIAVSLMLLLCPLTSIAGPVEDCVANYHREMEETAAQLEEARGGALRGYRNQQPDLTGLDVTEEHYQRHVRDPHGRPVFKNATRWHYTDAEGKQVTLFDYVHVDQAAERQRVEALSEGMRKYEAGLPGLEAHCRKALTDP